MPTSYASPTPKTVIRVDVSKDPANTTVAPPAVVVVYRPQPVRLSPGVEMKVSLF